MLSLSRVCTLLLPWMALLLPHQMAEHGSALAWATARRPLHHHTSHRYRRRTLLGAHSATKVTSGGSRRASRTTASERCQLYVGYHNASRWPRLPEAAAPYAEGSGGGRIHHLRFIHDVLQVIVAKQPTTFGKSVFSLEFHTRLPSPFPVHTTSACHASTTAPVH